MPSGFAFCINLARPLKRRELIYHIPSTEVKAAATFVDFLILTFAAAPLPLPSAHPMHADRIIHIADNAYRNNILLHDAIVEFCTEYDGVHPFPNAVI